MKIRESGMPEEGVWNSFFHPERTLRKLGLNAECGAAVDFGCGYGTFSVAAARIVRGTVYAFDLDPAMIAATRAKAAQLGLKNLVTRERDFVARGTGMASAAAGYAMLFNILHAENPHVLLREAWRVLRPGGCLGIMHWICDAAAPRGPPMSIRPRPQQCRIRVEQAGFTGISGIIDLPPWHWGMTAGKPDNAADAGKPLLQ